MEVFHFKGTSMFPTLKKGDILLIDTKGNGFLRNGDLVIFERNNKKICHRVIFKLRRDGKIYFLEKGDNSLGTGLLEKEDILGKVKKIYREKDIFYPSVGNFLRLYIFITYAIFAILKRVKILFFRNARLFEFRMFFATLHKTSFIVFRTIKAE